MPLFRPRNRDLLPVVGEARNLRAIVNRYRRQSAWVRPSDAMVAAQPTVSQVSTRTVEKRDTFLWRILDTALAEAGLPAWEPQYQQRGTCVGQGFKLGADTVMALAAVIFGKRFPGRAAVAPVYAGSRVEVAGRPGRWDGSNGSWAAEWLTKWGVATLSELGLDSNSRNDDERLAVRWCGLRDGVPIEYEDMADDRPIMQTPLVTSVEELILALDSGAPVTDCSNLIPTGRCDRNGISPVSRSGGHCTLFWAVRWLNGDPVFLYQNSWGPNWGSVAIQGQPVGSVWITARDVLAILNQRDSHALIGINGLEPIDWLALAA